jgi:hypothetical protein
MCPACIAAAALIAAKAASAGGVTAVLAKKFGAKHAAGAPADQTSASADSPDFFAKFFRSSKL